MTAMNPRLQLERLSQKVSREFLRALDRDEYEEANNILREFSRKALPILQSLDKELTGRNDSRLTEKGLYEALFEGSGSYVYYLSDGGYSRLVFDIMQTMGSSSLPFGIERGLATARTLSRWDEMRKASGGLLAELERRVEALLSEAESREGKITYEEAKEIGGPFKEWFLATFLIERSTTPRGGKKVKEEARKLLWALTNGIYIGGGWTIQSVRAAWGQFRPLAPTLVKLFSDEGKDKDHLREKKTSLATYVNQRGLSNKTFLKYVGVIEAVIGNLKGWRRKALGRGLRVILASPDHFRGTASGKYRREEDALYVRATPKVLKRTSGAYASPEYIIVHELGHRYEYKQRVPLDFDRTPWTTTRYSRTEGEAFAELFALGHFGYPEYSDILVKFEEVMTGKKKRRATMGPRAIARSIAERLSCGPHPCQCGGACQCGGTCRSKGADQAKDAEQMVYFDADHIDVDVTIGEVEIENKGGQPDMIGGLKGEYYGDIPFSETYGDLGAKLQFGSCFNEVAQAENSLVLASNNHPCDGGFYGCEPTPYPPRTHVLSAGCNTDELPAEPKHRDPVRPRQGDSWKLAGWDRGLTVDQVELKLSYADREAYVPFVPGARPDLQDQQEERPFNEYIHPDALPNDDESEAHPATPTPAEVLIRKASAGRVRPYLLKYLKILGEKIRPKIKIRGRGGWAKPCGPAEILAPPRLSSRSASSTTRPPWKGSLPMRWSTTLSS